MSIKKSTIVPFLAPLASFAVLSIPALAFAASDADYFPICACCLSNDPCTFKNFFEVIDKLIKALLYLSFFIAVIMNIKGGVTIIIGSGSDAERKKGRETITYAIYGMLVAFGAWLIINTVLTVFTGGDKSIGSYLTF